MGKNDKKVGKGKHVANVRPSLTIDDSSDGTSSGGMGVAQVAAIVGLVSVAIIGAVAAVMHRTAFKSEPQRSTRTVGRSLSSGAMTTDV
jgi:hypothetical protein